MSKNIKIVSLIILIVIIAGLSSFIPRWFLWKEIKTTADGNDPLKVSILIAKPERQPISLTLPSTTSPMRFTPIWSRVDGYLNDFYVDIGDQVHENDPMATIETPELDKELLQAKADLLDAIAKLEIASISAKRWETLYQRNSEAVPKQEVDERNATLQSSQALVEASAANVQRLEKLQNFKNIIAPFSGIVTKRNIDRGSLITAGSAGNPQQLFVVSQIDVLRVFVDVPQPFFRLIKDGMETKVYIQEFADPFQGTVARTSGALDQVSRTLLTEIHVQNKEGLLTSGLYANVTFSLTPTADYFIVPTKSVIIINDGPKVALLDKEETVQIVPIEIGRDWGKTIEITAGIKENDRIITNPGSKIRSGMRAKVHIHENEDEKVSK